MAAKNSTEATLTSKYVDGISRGLSQTEQTLKTGFTAMQSGAASLASGFGAAFQGITDRLRSYADTLRQRADESQSQFGKISAGAAAFGVIVVAAFLRMTKAVADFFLGLAEKSSEVLELKLAFESLTATMGVNASVMEGQLRAATEGLVRSSVLLRNANRVLSADIPLTTDQYVQLVGNVFKLAKAAGVDAPQALNTLTDALVRGNARGFQTIGLQVQVKDAVSEMAQALGQSTSKLETDAKLRAFYNELLERTAAATGRNATDYFSLADAIAKGKVTWDEFLDRIGEGIGRSAVLEELLKRLSKAFDGMALNEAGIKSLALGVNTFVITTIRGIASVIEAVLSLDWLWASVWASMKAIFFAVVEVASWVAGTVVHFIGRIAEALSLIPGAIGASFARVVPHIAELRDTLYGFMDSAKAKFNSSFDGFGEGSAKALLFAENLRGTAADLERFAKQAIRGEAGARQLGKSGTDGAEGVKKLNEQLKAAADLLRELSGRTATPYQNALLKYQQDLEKIGQLTSIGEARQNELRLKAMEAYFAEVKKLQTKSAQDQADLQREADAISASIAAEGVKRGIEQWGATIDQLTGEAGRKAQEAFERTMAEIRKKKEQERQKEVQEAVAQASAIERAVQAARQGNIPRQVGVDAINQIPRQVQQIQAKIAELRGQKALSADQLEDLLKLYDALDRLKHLNMSPFHQVLGDLRQSIGDFAAQATQAFASFFADVVSGQEGAGKKLLAAFIGMIGQMLVRTGMMLVQAGIAEIALAHTVVGRFMGASAAAGAKAIATGLIVAAAGGIMMGAASAMAQTNEAGAGGSFQQDVPRPIASNQVQVIQVGAPRGPQNAGQASQVSGELKITVAPPKGWVAEEVEREIRGNNNMRLRAVIQNA